MSSVALHDAAAARGILPRLPDSPDLASASFLSHPLGAVDLVLAIVVLVPLVEELAFRGKMQYELEHALGVVPAIVLPAAIFSALHGVINAIHHLPFALFTGWVVWRTASIWGAVYMHAINNAVVAGAVYLPQRWLAGDTLPPGIWPYAIVAGIVALSSLVAIGMRVNAIADRPRRRALFWPTALPATARR